MWDKMKLKLILLVTMFTKLYHLYVDIIESFTKNLYQYLINFMLIIRIFKLKTALLLNNTYVLL